MSIRIVPKDQLGKQREKGTTAGNIPPLLFANLKSLYTRRTERLQQLALDNPLADYLDFAAKITEAQQKHCMTIRWSWICKPSWCNQRPVASPPWTGVFFRVPNIGASCYPR